MLTEKQQADLNAAVLDYLTQKGFANAAAALKTEVRAPPRSTRFMLHAGTVWCRHCSFSFLPSGKSNAIVSTAQLAGDAGRSAGAVGEAHLAPGSLGCSCRSGEALPLPLPSPRLA